MKWSKIKKSLFCSMCLILLIGVAGCKSKDEDLTTPKENLTEAQLYNQFKSAYTNRKLYKSDFTQSMSFTTKAVTSATNYTESSSSEEMTYNAQTGEGYIILESDLLDEVNTRTYVLKESDEYIMYYSDGEDVELFYTDENYLLNEITDNYTDITDYISQKNPNSYTTISKYIEALKGNIAEDLLVTSESIAVTYSLKENAYADYSLDIDFSLTTSALNFKAKIDFDFDKSTINKFDYKKDSKSSNLISTYEEIIDIGFEKKYDSQGMNFDKNPYSTKLPGQLVIANIDLDLTSGFATLGYDFTKKVKAGTNINETLNYLVEQYSGEENIFLGWFYDEACTNKVKDNDVFSGSSIHLYGNIGTQTYNITNVQSNYGTYTNYHNAVKGQTLYITTFPKNGYVTSEMYYIEEGSTTKHYFTNSFVMPNKNITIYVIFGDTINLRTKEDLLTQLQDFDNRNKNFKLMNDIDLKGIDWEPIQAFTGTFDGNHHTISNLTIRTYHEYGGFFSIMNGEVKNLSLTNINITYTSDDSIIVGGLVGDLRDGKIENSFVSGTINVVSNDAAVYAGGLVGRSVSTNNISDTYQNVIKDSYADVIVSVQSSSSEFLASAGGLIGIIYSSTLVSDSYATGNVSCRNYGVSAFAGGLVGESINNNNDVRIMGSYATGNVTATVYSNSLAVAGGLVAAYPENSGPSIVNCYKYNGQQIYSTGNRISNLGTSASMSQIYQFVYNNWDDTIWNITSTANPTLK